MPSEPVMIGIAVVVEVRHHVGVGSPACGQFQATGHVVFVIFIAQVYIQGEVRIELCKAFKE